MNGSILIYVLTLLTFTLLICVNIFKSSNYFFEISIKKQEYVQKTLLAEAVLNYGIEFIKINFEKMKNTCTSMQIPFNLIKDFKNEKLYPKLKIYNKGDNTFLVKVEIINSSKKVIVAIECLLNKTAKDSFINNWKICAI